MTDSRRYHPVEVVEEEAKHRRLGAGDRETQGAPDPQEVVVVDERVRRAGSAARRSEGGAPGLEVGGVSRDGASNPPARPAARAGAHPAGATARVEVRTTRARRRSRSSDGQAKDRHVGVDTAGTGLDGMHERLLCTSVERRRRRSDGRAIALAGGVPTVATRDGSVSAICRISDRRRRQVMQQDPVRGRPMREP